MNPQDSDDLTGKKCEEGSSDVECEDDGTWTMQERRVVGAAVCASFTLVLGTYYWQPLLASFEADDTLKWDADDSRYINTACGLAEVIGLLFIGQAGDHFSGRHILGLQGALACVGLISVSLVHQTFGIVTIVVIVSFAKGLTWPTLGALISANVGRSKHDMVFILIAMGSRCGDVIAGFLSGALLHNIGFDWRQAVLSIAVVVIVGMVSSFLISPNDVRAPHDNTVISLDHSLEKFKRLLTSCNGLLSLLALMGTCLVWAWASYLSPVIRDVYHVDAGIAASAQGLFPLGAFAGLGIALQLSASNSRHWQVMQTAVAALAAGTIVAMSWGADAKTAQALPLKVLNALVFAIGFGFVIACYLPYLTYAANSPRGDRAFRLGILDGSSGAIGVVFSYIFGTMRENTSSAAALPKMTAIMMLGPCLSCVSMYILYKRLNFHATAETMHRGAAGSAEPREDDALMS